MPKSHLNRYSKRVNAPIRITPKAAKRIIRLFFSTVNCLERRARTARARPDKIKATAALGFIETRSGKILFKKVILNIQPIRTRKPTRQLIRLAAGTMNLVIWGKETCLCRSIL
jgi:hypothetical protein